MKTFPSFEAAAEYLMRSDTLEGVKVVSFDVFDTLLFRRLAPDAILKGLSGQLTGWLERQGFIPRRPLWEARHEAYARAAERNVAQGLDFDASLDQLLPLWLEVALQERPPEELAGRFVAHAQELELAFESSVCFPNPILRPALEHLRKRKLRAVFTSDMYLGERRVRELLGGAELAHFFDAGYVSCDVGLLKRTGRLFEHLVGAERCSADELLHLGDDPESDGRQAAQRGLRAVVVGGPRERARRRAQRYDADRLGHDRCHAGYALAEAAALDHRPATLEEEYGFRVLGPVFCGFLHRVAERCRLEGVDRVYFVAREGFGLRGVFAPIEKLVWPEGDAPSTHYLCVSRLTTFLAASRGFGMRELTLTLGNLGRPSVRKLLAPFSLPEAPLREAAAKVGIADIDGELPDPLIHWPPLQRLLESEPLRAMLLARAEQARSALAEYLEAMAFFAPGRAALVDVGWGGQIQDNLFHAFGARPDFPRLFGLYLGGRLSAFHRETALSSFEPILADETEPNWQGRAAFEFVQSFEAVCRAPHGTVIGYERAPSGAIRPMFRPDSEPSRRKEMADDERLALFQRGMFEFARRYARLAAVLGARAVDTLGYASSVMDRMIRFPSSEEAAWLLSLSNVSDLGLTDVVTLGTGRRGLAQLGALREFRQRLGGSYWKQGTVAGLGRAALLAYNIRRGVKTSPPPETIGRRAMPFVRRPPEPSLRRPARPEPPSAQEAAEAELRRELERRHEVLLEEGRRTRRATPSGAPRVVGAADLALVNALFASVNFINRRVGRQTYRSGGVGVKPMLGRLMASLSGFLEGRRP